MLRARDPLFNSSVEKALAVLETFGGERRALSLAELAAGAGMSTSSAQRCTHTLVHLGYLRRDARMKRWVLTPRTLALSHAYLSGHALLEQATTHLIDLNQASGESVSFSEPDGTDMVYIARFPSLKRFYIHMPVGRRLPMYCTAAGRAYLSALPRDEVRAILQRSALRAYTPHTLTDIPRILEIVDAARELGYAWASEECYR
ncbi:MAG TPA: helix-turn-helix domain-containing protein, partial [Steroidobacteraceae bacterium]|nr:helix-turn-helix domain-containing protein [Steroidobacteraceae bacterium]